MSGSRLRVRLDEARRSGRFAMSELSVLSNRRDPYRVDTPALNRDGAWVAEQIARLAVKLPVHLRGLHYALVAAGNVIKPDGSTYTNTEENWTWLADVAAKAARWLGFVPFTDVIDARNDEPAIFVPERDNPRPSIFCSFSFHLPDADDLTPTPSLSGFQPRQAYRLCLCGEKTSLAPILDPIARRFGAEMVLPTGEMSDTLVYGIASRAAADGRPLIVMYYSDFDPSGHQMPISVARKLQALADLMDLPPIQVHRAALTVDQVKTLDLPSTPLKETERRAEGWRKRWGHEQTEIDALTALRPDVLIRIAEDAIAPFYDNSLRGRVAEAAREWQNAAEVALARQVDDDWLSSARDDLEALLEQIKPELERLQSELELDTSAIDLPPVPEVAPDLDGLPSPPTPLFDSADDWTAATRRLVANRALAE